MKLRSILFAYLTSLAIGAPAFGADLPPVIAKGIANVGSACTPTSCSGFYVGGFMGGAGGNADIVGNGLNGSVFAGGGIPGIAAGYQYANGNWFAAAEAAVGYRFSVNANINGAGGSNNSIFAYQIAKVGGNLGGLFGNSAEPVAIPPKLANALISPYVLTGIVETKFATGWASGAGATFDIGPHTFVDLKYMFVHYGPSRNGVLRISDDNLVLAGLNYKF